MPSAHFSKKDLPFLMAGSGAMTVDTGAVPLTAPIPEDSSPWSVAFDAKGGQPVALGQSGTVKLGLSATARAALTPIFPATADRARALLADNGLADFFAQGANAEKLLLAFDVRAAADAEGSASFRYAALTATATVDAGADGGYTYLRAFDATSPAGTILPAFFGRMRLPEQTTVAPEPGEAIALRFGGYLRLAAEAVAGYELTGTKSIALGELALSERYGLSVIGKVGLSTGIAGRFSVVVTAADGHAGWSRVVVRRHRATDLTIAADVGVTFANQLHDLPTDAHDFLGAALGVNGKSLLTVLGKLHQLSDFDRFAATVDGLAKQMVSTWTGKAFDALASKTHLKAVLTRIRTVERSYATVGDRAVTLFDHYFDRLAELTSFLEELRTIDATVLETLRSRLTADRWSMLAQLTDGDPLGALVGRMTGTPATSDAFTELRQRVDAALALVRDAAHGELRDVIATAKREFRIDALFREAAKIDTIDELKAVANDKVGLFITRLVGRTLDSNSNLKSALRDTHEALDRLDAFTSRLYDSIKEATNRSYAMALHAEYSRATERDALVDVLINTTLPQGQSLLREAARGDFESVLAVKDAELVRLREGVFTHRTQRQRAFKVNIIGWHLDYSYERFDRVITESTQRLIPSASGIVVLSTATLTIEGSRKRLDEEMHVNFLLRALGESANAIKGSGMTADYVIDSLSRLTASYGLRFTDDDTSELELNDYLAFARDVGLDAQGATMAQLLPFLPRAANNGFGRVDASYDVRFGSKAVQALLGVKKLTTAAEAAIRRRMRQMVLSNYLKSQELHDVAFAYATPQVFAIFQKEGFATFSNPSSRVLPVSTDLGIAGPSKVVLDRVSLKHVVTLFSIENSMVDAIKSLLKLVSGSQPMTAASFEKKVAAFGEALADFDRFDQTTNQGSTGASTIFAMFDALVRLAGATPANAAVLRLSSDAGGRRVEKLFLTPLADD